MIGVVLCGGSSTRFGIDKLFYPIKGKPLVAYPIEALRRLRCVERVVAVASPWNVDRVSELGVDTVVDELLMGPAGALLKVLRMFSEVLLLAGDMPLITPSTLERLVLECSRSIDSWACVPRWSSTGFLEPLCAVYRRPFAKALEEGLCRGIASLQRIVKAVRVKFVPVERICRNPELELLNVNTLGNLQRVLEAIDSY